MKKKLFGEAFALAAKLWDLFVREVLPSRKARLKDIYIKAAIRANRRLDLFQNSPEWLA